MSYESRDVVRYIYFAEVVSCDFLIFKNYIMSHELLFIQQHTAIATMPLDRCKDTRNKPYPRSKIAKRFVATDEIRGQ